MSSRKGVSPVIATVLLIVLVIVIASIIVIWSRNFIPKTIEKDGEPIERSCERVSLDVSVFSNATGKYLDANNKGNVDVYGFAVRIVGEGSLTSKQPIEHSLAPGQSTRTYLNTSIYPEFTGNVKVRLTPILLGLEKNKETTFECTQPSFDINL